MRTDVDETVRQTALEADSGRKISCRTGGSNPRQYFSCAWLFSRTLYPLSYPLSPSLLLSGVLFASPSVVKKGLVYGHCLVHATLSPHFGRKMERAHIASSFSSESFILVVTVERQVEPHPTSWISVPASTSRVTTRCKPGPATTPTQARSLISLLLVLLLVLDLFNGFPKQLADV